MPIGTGQVQHLDDWLALAFAPGVGPRTSASLLAHFGSAAAVRVATPAALRAAGLAPAAIAALSQPDQTAIARVLDWAAAAQAHILTRDDPRYPPLLAAIAAPPPVLYVRGDPLLLAEPQLAIVGSRNPTPGGRETTIAFARALAQLGLVITSGLAAGIDAAAHRGALVGGRTIAVLGTGPDRIYPASHRELAHAVADNGALVSEFPPGSGPRASHFPRRNRIISGLTLGTLVTEAALQSGSLITARYAAEQGREVFAIPGSIHNPLARGCHALIRQGAKLVDGIDQLLEELAPQLQHLLAPVVSAPDTTAVAPALAGPDARGLDAQGPDAPGLDADYQTLLAAMGHDPTAPDELIARTGLTAQSVSSMLLLLELQGYVSSHPGGRYSRLLPAPASR
ncbi:MAG: DNA-protecting protein DprA [Chromatiaceae bacterium]|nr:MAG: DNA-protecting protein DprA [Chromatiaceae bacterium]